MVHASEHTSMQRARGKSQRIPRELGEPTDHALGRSRGGFTAKLHLVTDGRGLPLAVELSAGEAAESKYAAPVLSAVEIPQPKGRCGRPRTRAEMVVDDNGYGYSRSATLAERPSNTRSDF